jgi:AcrR family transcriptional regulator
MSPKSKEQFEAIRQKSEATIKEVALELFATKGYNNTSISQIAKAANISKGLMYNYFDSKEDLLHTILIEAVEEGAGSMQEFLQNRYDPLEELIGITRASIGMVKTNFNYWRLMTALAFQENVVSDVKEILDKKQEVIINQVFSIFERLGAANPKLEAYFYGAVLDGMMVHYINMGDNYPLDEMEAFIIEDLKRKYGGGKDES